jgi:flagellar hook-associated protein 2
MSSTGALSSLGIGSGVLTSSVIDQLKASDTTMEITPINNKIATNMKKQQDISLLDSLLSSFSSSVSSLSSDSLYQNRTVAGSSAGASVTASAGADIQSFTISNTKLATSDIVQSGSFSDPTATIASGTGTLNLNINGKDYKIAYDATTTYQGLRQAITDAAGTDVKASVLQTGGSAYSLVLSSNNTGANQQITLTDLSNNLKAPSPLIENSLTSASFASDTSAIATGSGTLTLNTGGVISYDSTTSLSDLANKINSDPTASANVTAHVMQSSTGTYSLVLNAKGSNQTVPTLTDSSGGGMSALLTGSTSTTGGATDVQSASDATFQYNGINMTRSSNTITDISSGVTINLLSNSSSTANINITQDTQPIKDAMSSMVTSYNALQKQLATLTNSNTANGAIGDFSGDSTINGIDRGIKNILTSVDSSSGLGLTQYGLSINSDGTLSFDSTAFDKQNAVNPSALSNYFSGGTTVNSQGKSITSVGVFNTLYSNLQNLTNSTNGTLTNFLTGIQTQGTDLQANLTQTTNLLNAKYATLTSKFIAYDSAISQLNNSFSSLSQTITRTNNGG